MNEQLTKLFIQLSKRAEKVERQALIDSFVDVGPLVTVLSTVDNQILYGRRGTGKTHALVYVAEEKKKRGDIPIYVDLRTIGSTGGLYSDGDIPISERATRLLVDTLAAMHDELTGAVLDDYYKLNLAELGPVLDALAEAITEVTVKGSVKEEQGAERSDRSRSTTDTKFNISSKEIMLGSGSNDEQDSSSKKSVTITREGVTTHRVHFGRVGAVFADLARILSGKRIWLLLDEWSVVPSELQPYLADLIRRAIFPVPTITVKIGAIEKRSRFQLYLENGDYIGIELGGDATADLNMDDFMVFDNDEEKAVSFFANLIFRHVSTLAKQESVEVPTQATDLIRVAFTQENVFREFVRAAEGIPRDAFCILSLAAQKDFATAITMDTLRKCSKTWYQRDKETAVSANPSALELLHWIIDDVIAHRRARAFLFRRGEASELIDNLFDARVLHLLKRNISAHDQPGVRYDVYKIDYGCYVDLLSTVRAPQGLLGLDDGGFANVPPDDYRAIRRAILDIVAFKERKSR